MAPLRDYVDLFDHTAQQIRDNSTRLKLDGGGYEWRHTIITGQTDTVTVTLSPRITSNVLSVLSVSRILHFLSHTRIYLFPIPP